MATSSKPCIPRGKTLSKECDRSIPVRTSKVTNEVPPMIDERVTRPRLVATANPLDDITMLRPPCCLRRWDCTRVMLSSSRRRMLYLCNAIRSSQALCMIIHSACEDRIALQRYNILLLLLLNITLVQSQRRRQQGGRNIVISSNGLAVATSLGRVTRSSIIGGTSLVTFDVRTGIERSHSFDNVLPRGIQGFDDVAISEGTATSSTGRNGARRRKYK